MILKNDNLLFKDLFRKIFPLIALAMMQVGFINVVNAQTLNPLLQVNLDNDYFIEMEWSGTGGNCQCQNYYDQLRVWKSGMTNPSQVLWQSPQMPSNGGTQTSQTYGNIMVANPPGTSIALYTLMWTIGANDGFGPCQGLCAITSSDRTNTYTTGPLKKVENVTNSFFYNMSTADLTLNWDVVTAIPQANYTLEILENSVVVFSTTSKTVTSWSTNGLAFGSQHSYTFRTKFNNGTVSKQSDRVVSINVPTPAGIISGKITTGINGTGAPVGGVMVCAERTSAVTGGNLGVTYCDVSDPADGTYEIRDIYFGPTGGTSSTATFKVTPSLTNRMFVPTMINKTLTYNSPNSQNVNFQDITSFVVSGKAYQVENGVQCPLKNVEIAAYKNGQIVTAPQMTSDSGTYNLTIMNPGIHYIKAKLGDHIFTNDSIMVDVQNNVTGINFNDLDRNILKGYVRAGCEEYIGQATLTITDSFNCIQKIVTTNAGSGYYEVELPSKYYRVELTGITTNDPNIVANDVLVQFGVRRILLDSMIQMDFIYRKPLEVKILGLPAPSCAQVPYPILVKNAEYSIAIRVSEGSNCASDTGYVVVSNSLVGMIGTNRIDTVPIQNGIAVYSFVAGDPNIIGSQHTRPISFVAYVGGANSQPLDKLVVITGAVQRGNTFITTSPEIPYLILRDPPGDQSFAFFEQDSTITLTQSFSAKLGGGVNVWLKAKAGVDIFSLKIWGKIGGYIDISGNTTNKDEFVVQMKSSQRFETSNDQLVVGARGDVFVGAAMNLKYAAADELKFDLNTCSLDRDTTLMIDQNNIATEFFYTEYHIRNTLIPQLKDFVKTAPPGETLATFNASRSIKTWEQILALNDDLKKRALNNGEVSNISFDGADGPIQRSYTKSSSQTKSIEFQTLIDAQVAAEAGFEIAGNGLSAGVKVNFRTDIGRSEATNITTTTTTGYVFDDDDLGDFISANVVTDPVYGTPVFELLAGATRCPHEEGTSKRDFGSISVQNPIQYGLPGVNELYYNVILANQSETGYAGTYELSLTNASNPGANVTQGFSSLGAGLQFFALSPGETMVEVKVARNPGSSLYAFEGLELCFYPECNPLDASCTKISAFFTSPCSPISLASPSSSWLINSSSNNMMNINIKDYDLGTTINEVRLEYAKKGTNSWLPSNIILAKTDLINNVNGTNKTWQTANIPDGEYDIRLRLNCGTAFNYSERRSGRIDRSAPLVLGLEEPLDDDYRAGDEISVIFNEDIDCDVLTNANVTLKLLPQNTIVPAQLICDGRKITVVPINGIANLLLQSVEVSIAGVTDKFGNVNSSPIIWTFNVADPDTDGDGIPDSKDRCPGKNDYIDSDLGGRPDGCDCFPLLVGNDTMAICTTCNSNASTVMHFDGINDQISIGGPLNPSANIFTETPNNFSYEFWVMPEDSIPMGMVQAPTGTLPFNTPGAKIPYVIFPMNGHNFEAGASTLGVAVGKNGITVTEHGDNLAANIIVYYHPITDWTRVVVTCLAGQIVKLWVNGDLVAGGALNFTGSNKYASTVIGGNQNNTNAHFFKGKIDDLAIWYYERNPVEIALSTFKHPSKTDPLLAAYFDFDEGSPGQNNTAITRLINQAGNVARNATILNMGRTTNTSNWVSAPLRLCEGCQNELTLDSRFGGLDGLYQAADKITVMANSIWNPSGNVILDAPMVEIKTNVTVPNATLLTIKPNGCD